MSSQHIGHRKLLVVRWFALLLARQNRSHNGYDSKPWQKKTVIQNGFDPREVDSLSSHSCKTTILSWAAKRGLDKSVRKILGYHVQPDDVSPLTYGRDNLSAPLYQAIAMMKEIAEGKFSPDSSRSARFPKGVKVSAGVAASSTSLASTETLTNAEPSEDSASIPIVVIERSVLPPSPVSKGKSASAELLESSSHSSVSDEAAEDPTSTEDSDVENELVTEQQLDKITDTYTQVYDIISKVIDKTKE